MTMFRPLTQTLEAQCKQPVAAGNTSSLIPKLLPSIQGKSLPGQSHEIRYGGTSSLEALRARGLGRWSSRIDSSVPQCGRFSVVAARSGSSFSVRGGVGLPRVTEVIQAGNCPQCRPFVSAESIQPSYNPKPRYLPISTKCQVHKCFARKPFGVFQDL